MHIVALTTFISLSLLDGTMGNYGEPYLPVDYDAPDEPEDEFVISINDVRRSDIHQFHLEERKKTQ